MPEGCRPAGAEIACRDPLEPLHAHRTVVVTGREAPQGLVDVADLVTEMRCVKHPYARGVPALPGVDL